MANASIHSKTQVETQAQQEGTTTRDGHAKHGHLREALLFSQRTVQLCGAALDAVEDAWGSNSKKKNKSLSAEPIVSLLRNAASAAKVIASAIAVRMGTAALTGDSSMAALANVKV